jgi:two-component system, cell cycle response regulator DivK
VRVLVAEDNAANRELLREALGAKGHAVTEALDGEEVLAMLDTSLPDVVLLDIQMPRLDGYQVIQRIRGNRGWQGLKVIALTAFAMRGEEQRALSAGFDGYLSKPVSLAALYRKLDEFSQP